MKKKAAKKPAKRLSEKDWADMQSEYASSSISYRKLAEKHGVSFNTLKERAVNEHWTDKKKKYRETYTKKTQQTLARTRARACAKDLNNLGAAAGNISDAIKKILKDSEQFKRHIITEAIGDGATEVSERIFDKADTRAIRDIAGAMKDLTYVIRNIYGVPGVIEKNAMDLAAEKLLLEKEKAQKDSGASTINVNIIDPPERPNKQDEPKENEGNEPE